MGCFGFFISIHALLAESDYDGPDYTIEHIISIHALLAESDLFQESTGMLQAISIHALLAESDYPAAACRPRAADFYPRSPNGTLSVLAPYFYPRSPCGERRSVSIWLLLYRIFLSTLSLRRATVAQLADAFRRRISIHALLAESDLRWLSSRRKGRDFYPRSPCGERPINT
mgnify:CR=1 FL=1